MVKTENLDPTLAADVLQRMARGERFDAEIQAAVLQAAAKVMREHHSLPMNTPWMVKALWFVGVLALAAALFAAALIFQFVFSWGR